MSTAALDRPARPALSTPQRADLNAEYNLLFQRKRDLEKQIADLDRRMTEINGLLTETEDEFRERMRRESDERRLEEVKAGRW